MSDLIVFNKPFQVLSQFTPIEDKSSLSDYIDIINVYPAGRLDYDSEGLLLLTDDGALQARIAEPKFKLPKTYWVQVEGQPSDEAVKSLKTGLELKDGITKPANVKSISEPKVWPRNPPIRHRANSPTSWLELTITEGKNRQVRRMTAAVGHPTLRLIRVKIGPWSLENLAPGQYRKETVNLPTNKHNKQNSHIRSSKQRKGSARK